MATRATSVLVDISSLDVVDSFIGRMLDHIAAESRILDAETVAVGVQPSVAITLVELDLSLTGMRTARNVERGMALLGRSLAGGREARVPDPGHESGPGSRLRVGRDDGGERRPLGP